jgi:hypothetical protein
VVTSIPLVSRTRATFRSAEFGFFGVEVYTRVQTPRFWGQLCNAGLAVFQRGGFRPLRTSWLKVGTNLPLSLLKAWMGALGPPNIRTSPTACVYGLQLRGSLFGQVHIPFRG